VEIAISTGGYSRTTSENSISTGGFLKQTASGNYIFTGGFLNKTTSGNAIFTGGFLFSHQWKFSCLFLNFQSVLKFIYIYTHKHIYIYIDIDKHVVLILKATWN
jgi:hypothetical protein